MPWLLTLSFCLSRAMMNSNKMTINLALFGMTQSGKSSAGNIILGSMTSRAALLHALWPKIVAWAQLSLPQLHASRRQEVTLQVQVLDTPVTRTAGWARSTWDRRSGGPGTSLWAGGLHLALLVQRADVPLWTGRASPVQMIQVKSSHTSNIMPILDGITLTEWTMKTG